MVCLPASIENASRTWTRLKVSSTPGSRKNGEPKRKVVAKPIAVSAGTFDLVSERGRSSREKPMCPSFTFFAENVLNTLKFTELILDGPSVPLAESPYVGTSNVWFALLERSKLYDAL